jgi:hypothetical protein
MLAAASDFATTVADHPVPYRAELQDYRALDLPAPPNAAELQNAKDVLADCGARREAWLQYRNDIAYIVANPAQFETPPVALSVLDQESATALNQIKTSASTCLNAIKSCAFTSASLPDRSKLPNRKSTSGDADSQANRGAALARLDPLALAIRNSLPKLVQHGFDLGMAIAEGQTLLGPGKQGFIDTLPTPDEKHGCEIGVDYSVDRNRNSVLAQAGRAVASAHPTVQRARDAEPPGLFTLGFDIATGIFGDPNPTFPEPHALGHTLDGPGAQKILADLTSEVQRGFKVSRDLNLGPPPLRT